MKSLLKVNSRGVSTHSAKRGYLDGGQDFFDNPRRGVEVAGQSNVKYRASDVLDVIGRDKVTALQVSAGLRNPLPGNQPARTESQRDLFVLPRRLAQVDQILEHLFRKRDLGNVFLKLAQLARADHGFRLRPHAIGRPDVRCQHIDLAAAIRVADPQLRGEPVKLRFRQGVSAVAFDRVLCRDHKESLVEWIRLVVDGHLSFGHRFEQSTLGPRRGAIDLVRQQHIRKHRTTTKFELVCLLVEHVEAGDVCRQQVGCALDAREMAPDRVGDSLGQRRLSQSRQVVEQQVPASQQAGQDAFDNVVLADERLA